MADYTVELALDAHCDLGESPIYDDRTENLYFVDINRNAIHAFNTVSNKLTSLHLQETLGAIALTSDPDHLLAATQREIVLVRFWADSNDLRGPVRTLAMTPEAHGIDKMRFNDGKVSPQGSFLIGRMHSSWRTGERGRVYALDPGSSELRQVLSPEDVNLPNGIAWNHNGTSCYFVDSGEETITCYATDDLGIPINDDASKKLVYNHKTGHKHVPDGICIDSSGNLWIALGESASILCINPTTGEEIQKITLPVQRPTSCIFGGNDLQDLYVTTRIESGDGASEQHGGLFRVKGLGVKGLRKEGEYKL